MSTSKALGTGGDSGGPLPEAEGIRAAGSQWRCRFGELDLVAQDRQGTICFVEVKLRSVGDPRPAAGGGWTGGSRRRLLTAAAAISAARQIDSPARFDVAEVYHRRTPQRHENGIFRRRV